LSILEMEYLNWYFGIWLSKGRLHCDI
jgi:hypothetical protein